VTGLFRGRVPCQQVVLGTVRAVGSRAMSSISSVRRHRMADVRLSAADRRKLVTSVIRRPDLATFPSFAAVKQLTCLAQLCKGLTAQET
jgi:hypothetical protein